MPRPIITDSRFLAEIEGRRYAILRLQDSALRDCTEAQERLQNAIRGFDAVYPAPHLTLFNFRSHADFGDIRALTALWAARTPRFDLKIEQIGIFPAPSQVIHVSIRKDAAAVHAYGELRSEAIRRGLGGHSYETHHWIPHVSLAYCHRLNLKEWEAAMKILQTSNFSVSSSSSDQANEVDIVAYEHGKEVVVATYALLGNASES